MRPARCKGLCQRRAGHFERREMSKEKESESIIKLKLLRQDMIGETGWRMQTLDEAIELLEAEPELNCPNCSYRIKALGLPDFNNSEPEPTEFDTRKFKELLNIDGIKSFVKYAERMADICIEAEKSCHVINYLRVENSQLHLRHGVDIKEIDRLTEELKARNSLLNKIYNYSFNLNPDIKKEIEQVLKG